MKFAVCALAKNENLYLREWIEHYIKIGFDKIVIYDNNDTAGEFPNSVIQDYINQDIVDVYADYRGKSISNHPLKVQYLQRKVYNECIEKYKDSIDWILFTDIDEFLQLEKHTKIQYLFEEMNYNAFDAIAISWYNLGGDDLYYESRPVQERFTKKIEYSLNDIDADTYIKTMVKTSSTARYTYSEHSTNSTNAGTANLININGSSFVCLWEHIHENMYINHYRFKSLTEYLYRKKNWYKNVPGAQTFHIMEYKHAHSWSEEHEKIYQNFLNMDNEKAS